MLPGGVANGEDKRVLSFSQEKQSTLLFLLLDFLFKYAILKS